MAVEEKVWLFITDSCGLLQVDVRRTITRDPDAVKRTNRRQPEEAVQL
jgi:hypothetical protein